MPDGSDLKRIGRATTSVRKLLAATAPTDADADNAADADEAKDAQWLRKRWNKSALADLVPLPPERTWKDVPTGVREPYALLDAVGHRMLGERYHARIRAVEGLETIYAIDMAALPLLVRMEQVGMAVDGPKLERLAATFSQEYDATVDQIEALTGVRVNPKGSEQVSELLFETLGVTPTRPTKTGHYTTQDKYLKARRSEHAAIGLVLEARQIAKLRGTYAAKLPALLRDGRYYPDWRYTRTATGRLAEPMVVLIPKHTYRGLLVRNCFYAADGHDLVLCDLSQIEMRAMAFLSRDEVLLDVYRRGGDVHASTAHHVLGAPARKEDQDESKHRLPSKTVNFGIINGMTEYGLLDQLHENGLLDWTIEGVREFRIEWFRLHKGVDAYWQAQIAFARQHGYVADMFGRRRRMDAIWSEDDRIVREAERQALFPIQASADAISKIWNDRVWREIIRPMHAAGRRYCEPWTRVHDETTLEVDARAAKQVRARMLQLVPQALGDVPVTAEGIIEHTWGEGKLKKAQARMRAA